MSELLSVLKISGDRVELTVLESGELNVEGRLHREPDLEGRVDSCTVLETVFESSRCPSPT
jgi:hypothetical protein